MTLSVDKLRNSSRCNSSRSKLSCVEVSNGAARKRLTLFDSLTHRCDAMRCDYCLLTLSRAHNKLASTDSAANRAMCALQSLPATSPYVTVMLVRFKTPKLILTCIVFCMIVKRRLPCAMALTFFIQSVHFQHSPSTHRDATSSQVGKFVTLHDGNRKAHDATSTEDAKNARNVQLPVHVEAPRGHARESSPKS